MHGKSERGTDPALRMRCHLLRSHELSDECHQLTNTTLQRVHRTHRVPQPATRPQRTQQLPQQRHAIHWTRPPVDLLVRYMNANPTIYCTHVPPARSGGAHDSAGQPTPTFIREHDVEVASIYRMEEASNYSIGSSVGVHRESMCPTLKGGALVFNQERHEACTRPRVYVHKLVLNWVRHGAIHGESMSFLEACRA
ncbi:hypothetical protein PsorP6_016002 [Peronosclerospora sorghi]|uniref:Uncharacterized protein n=1 Tax=Peronosclerospora sorghi TaxID=230839 RepID=A0ACC0WNC4_9STRA|nr:hypothetical protein PsorP6_016002 [Peronosclerospora sorghi]